MRISRITRSQVSWAALSEQLCHAWGEHAQNFVPCFPNAVGTRLAFSERRKVKASSAPVGIGSSVAPARIPQKWVDHPLFLIAIRNDGWTGIKLLFACLSFTKSLQPIQGHYAACRRDNANGPARCSAAVRRAVMQM